MKKGSLRLRYFISYLLMLIPICIFALVIYFSVVTQTRLSTEKNRLQQLNYASESLSAMLTRLDDAVQLSELGEKLLQEERMSSGWTGEEACGQTLSTLEQRIAPGSELMVFRRGDNAAYSKNGRQTYGEWERAFAQDYNMRMSSAFSHIYGTREAALYPLYAADDAARASGLMACFPLPGREGMVLTCLMRSEWIMDIFTNYMGDVPGDLFIYTDSYRLLFSASASAEAVWPFEKTLRVRGMGVVFDTIDGKRCAVLRATDFAHGLTCAVVAPESVLYAQEGTYRGVMLALLTALLLVIAVLSFLLARTNYKPIRELTRYVSGGETDAETENELDLIRGRYNKRVLENEELSHHLLELTPIIMQQFVNRLIAEQFSTKDALIAMSVAAGQPFTHPFSAAVYAALGQTDEAGVTLNDLCALTVSRFSTAGCAVVALDLPMEKALCAFVCFDAPPGGEQKRIQELSQRFLRILTEHGTKETRLGVSPVCRDPMRLSRAFAQARAALVLMPENQRIFFYSSVEIPQTDKYIGVSAALLTLMTEGIARGDKESALLAFEEASNEMTRSTRSLLYFRFESGEISSRLIRLANQEHIAYEASQTDGLINYQTPEEFVRNGRSFVSWLCDAFQKRVCLENEKLRERTMHYLTANYRRYDLSIAVAAEEMQVSRPQLSAVIREMTGQNFAQYISYLRLNEFRRLLLETDMQIQDCVTAVGYTDVTNILRKFKAIEGVTPSQFRARQN